MDYFVTVFRIPIIEKKDNEKLLNEIKSNIKYFSNYDVLPDKFENLKTWPKMCNLLCINCGCKTKRIPFFIPQRMDSDGGLIRNNNPFTCSPCCAIRYINNRDIGEDAREVYYNYIIELVKKMTGIKDAVNIFQSLDPKELKKFGGHYSDQEYQYNIFITNRNIISNLYSNKKLLREELFDNTN